MKMARMQWKSRRTIASFLGVFFLYLMIRANYYEHKSFVFIPRVPPNQVWEFVADFSNMKYLNPTIIDFNIIEESGNYKHWKYTTEYSEKLSHWPNLPNHALAHFDVKSSPVKDVYYIYSTHRTCLFFGLYCLYTESEFKFGPGNSTKGAACEEYVKYQCPTLLSSFCRREVIYQRRAIMENLKKKFENNI
ncbi:unnamed protein product [Callosobruchus maculatus]|uniref:Uncharacterized protein n=1 Tax=Callosobruchus maculatus TaxID=64391 RepID=A0A653CFB9_CALMS|nr:unnamed protein product [Callosobruchus maculatus]